MGSDITESLKGIEKSHAYGLCVIGFMVPGAIASGITRRPQYIFATTLLGLANCSRIAPKLRDKLFSRTTRMTPREFQELARQVMLAHPSLSEDAALGLIADARRDSASKPSRYRRALNRP
ncbi:hypothetical protein [Mesorhizobium sp. LNHC209A00]|uniref:hypothetical protein n=1 Tax=Mesorhizobium TaxID=68287 RepID=UPI0003D017E3|nr:hypothetical protein [Mesorhizobium sp. LNHC209A00]ESY89464.1 hypothetical protein X738_31845 [Mesorhizobium sp. LNHC209A00]